MSLDTDNDERLILFLRGNSPRVPEPSPYLEDRIAGQLFQVPPLKWRIARSTWSHRYLALGVVTAGILIYWVFPHPVPQAAGPVPAELEEFIETSWDTTFSDSGSEEFPYALVDLSSMR